MTHSVPTLPSSDLQTAAASSIHPFELPLLLLGHLLPCRRDRRQRQIGLGIAREVERTAGVGQARRGRGAVTEAEGARPVAEGPAPLVGDVGLARSEEHPSELQSLMRISYAVFCL